MDPTQHSDKVRDSRTVEQTPHASAMHLARQRIRELEFEMVHAARLSLIGELMTGIVHELNQPLAAISNFAAACRNLLRDRDADLESIPGMLDRIIEQAQRASKTLKQVLQFARSGELHRSKIYLDALIADADSLIEMEARRHRVAVHTDLPSDVPPLDVDCIQIQQVLLNLIRNACESLSGSAALSRDIWIRAQVDDAFVEIIVEDNGPGISEEHLQKIFDPFFTTRLEGVGIGLVISKKIIEAHGGELRAENGPAGGARFRIRLPRASGDPG